MSRWSDGVYRMTAHEGELEIYDDDVLDARVLPEGRSEE